MSSNETEERKGEPSLFETLWERLPDADEYFAYDTVKEVRVLDRRLGLVYWSVLLLIILYVVIYVFMVKKMYQDIEKTDGWIISKVMNPVHDDKFRPWDIYDSVTNPGESGAVFLPTRVLITRGQTEEGFCESPAHSCKSAEDCDIGNTELQKVECVNNMCMRRGWCPSQRADDSATEIHYPDVENYQIWFQANLHYHKFMLDVSTCDELEPELYPSMSANTYPVHDMLRLADIELKDIREAGAVLSANKIFECDLDEKQCQVRLEVVNVDSKSGFTYVNNHYYLDADGNEVRDQYRYYGIRIATFATGIGKITAFSNIVLQVSSAIAMLACAQAAADAVMQSIVPERNHYIKDKVIETDDFNK